MGRQRLLFLCLAAIALVWLIDREEAVPAEARAELPETHYIALTFDDGPRPDTTGRLLDGLRERGASATFFLVGEQIRGNEDLVRRMRAEGHQVGNHTWSHENLQEMDRSAAQQQVQRTNDLLTEVLGPGTYWLRPPYGLLAEGAEDWFSMPLVHWSVDPEDWKLRNTQADVRAVLEKAGAGDIILMHDTVPASVDAALTIVDTLQEQGYLFVTVEELLALNGGKEPPLHRLIHSAASAVR